MRLVTLLVVALLLTACAGERSPGSTAATTAGAEGIRDRCLSAVPRNAPIRAEDEVTGAGIRMPIAVIGPEQVGPVVVLLHQVNSGACGWGRWATAAAHSGVTSVLVDLCGYGASDCTEQATLDIATQVQALVAYAQDLGGDRLALAGASMGGSQTVRAVAAGVEVDAWADVSGPPTWDRVRLLDVADQVPQGGLVVFARSDGALAYRAAQQLARRTGARFLDGGSGHGWDLLTTYTGRLLPAGRALVDHVAD